MNEEIVLLLKEIRDLLIDFRQVLGAKQIVNSLKAEDLYNTDDIEPKDGSFGLADIKIVEEVTQDLKGVTPMQATYYDDKSVKALLVVKNGWQAWVIGKAIESEFEAGVVTDLKVKEWGLKKLSWEKFVVRKLT